MFRWVINKLASVLPPAVDSDSAQMCFSTTHKRLFFRETRFLFLSEKGPVELALRPGHILAGIGGSLGLAALVYLSPALPSVSSLPSLPKLPTLSSLQQLASVVSFSNDQEKPVQPPGEGFLPSDSGMLAALPLSEIFAPDVAEDAPQANSDLQAADLNRPAIQPDTQLAARGMNNFTDIEEPNDELILGPLPDEVASSQAPAPSQASIAVPVARPAPEPMDPEFVAFDGLSNPPLQSERIRLHRRFANALSEVERIETMLGRLGISLDSQPEPWDSTLVPAEEHVSALYLYRDSWREILNLIPLKAPLRYYYVTSPYGMRTNKKSGIRRFHHGVDLAGTWKARLRPPTSGVVTFAGRDGGFGKVVRVEHAHGVETVYAHLSSILVSKGSFVTPQDVLGTMGNTGYSDGMHLHYEIRVNGKSKDPEDFFAFGHKLTVTGKLGGDL